MDKELTFTPVIGIEIHIQLKTDTKIFCGCSTDTGGEPNTHICPVCMGLRISIAVLVKYYALVHISCFNSSSSSVGAESKHSECYSH